MKIRGAKARKLLPAGKFHRIKSRNKKRGNKYGASLKEWMLTACGDPDTAITWMAQRIDDLEEMGYDVRRQRAGARFDTMKGLPWATEEDDYDQYQESDHEQEQDEEEPATAPAQSSSHSHSKHRSRSSRSSHSRFQSGPRTPRSEGRSREKKQARSDLLFQDPANIFSPDGEDPQDRADVAAKAENLESQLRRAASVEAALNALARITEPPAFIAGQALQLLRSSKEEVKSPAEPLETNMGDEVDFDPAAPMTPDDTPPGTPFGTITSAPKLPVPEDLVFSPRTPDRSTWERFLETAKNALSDCRACSHWKSNPQNLGDTLNSIAERVSKMQIEGPPIKEESPWTDPGLAEILFCVTCFKRDEQLKKALPLNLVCLAPYRHFVKIVLVTFGPDQTLQQWLQNELAWALEEGLLKLGSGGEAFGTDSPAGSWATRDGHKNRLTSWHASVAKNISHKAAIYFGTKSFEKTLLINLDGDNLVGLEYLAAVAKSALASKNSWHGKACPAVTCGDGSLTGRMAYWAEDFFAVCGYDQEPGVRPSG